MYTDFFQCLGAIATEHEAVLVCLYSSEDCEEQGNHLFLLCLSCNGMTKYRNLFIFLHDCVCILSVFGCMYACVCLPDEHMVRLPTAYHLPTVSNHLLN